MLEVINKMSTKAQKHKKHKNTENTKTQKTLKHGNMKTKKHESAKAQKAQTLKSVFVFLCFCVPVFRLKAVCFSVLRRSRVFLCFREEKGFIALISILIISAVMLAVGVGLSLRSIGETNMVLSEELSNRTLALSDACAEHALLELKNDLNYFGNESIIINGESCDILTIDGSGNLNRTVKTQSAVSNYVKKIKVEVSQVSPAMEIASWEEVGDF